MHIAFVVLHYLDYETTQKCINSLLKLKGTSTQIIVVDNGSRNNSYELLKDANVNNSNVTILKNENNEGFAKGNNLGFLYAKQIFSPKFVIVMNNDVIINDVDFGNKLTKITGYDLIGPDIVNLRGEHQNPFRQKCVSGVKLRIKLVYRFLSYILYHLPVIGQIKSKIKFIPITNRDMTFKNPDRQYNVVLHGSVIIYTENWIKNENLAFLPETFLYGEEDILYEYCMQKKYTTLFEPSIQVLHLEDQSTNMSIKSQHLKNKFINRHAYKSTKILYKYRKKTRKIGISYNNEVKL